MPVPLTPRQKVFAKMLGERLMARCAGSQAELGKIIGLNQSNVSRILTDGTTSMQTLQAMCDLLGVSWDDIPDRRVKPQAISRSKADDPPIVYLLSRVADLDGLKRWLLGNAELKLRTSEVCRAIDAYDHTPGLANHTDGEPIKGWSAFFEDFRAGLLGPSSEKGTPEAAKILELKAHRNIPRTNVPKKDDKR